MKLNFRDVVWGSTTLLTGMAARRRVPIILCNPGRLGARKIDRLGSIWEWLNLSRFPEFGSR